MLGGVYSVKRVFVQPMNDKSFCRRILSCRWQTAFICLVELMSATFCRRFEMKSSFVVAASNCAAGRPSLCLSHHADCVTESLIKLICRNGYETVGKGMQGKMICRTDSLFMSNYAASISRRVSNRRILLMPPNVQVFMKLGI